MSALLVLVSWIFFSKCFTVPEYARVEGREGVERYQVFFILVVLLKCFHVA